MKPTDGTPALIVSAVVRLRLSRMGIRSVERDLPIGIHVLLGQ